MLHLHLHVNQKSDYDMIKLSQFWWFKCFLTGPLPDRKIPVYKYKTITWRCSDDDDGVYWLQGISINQQFLYKRVWNLVEDMEGIPETWNKIKLIVGYKVSQ